MTENMSAFFTKCKTPWRYKVGRDFYFLPYKPDATYRCAVQNTAVLLSFSARVDKFKPPLAGHGMVVDFGLLNVFI
jgi:hypothetical protein